MCCRVIGSEIAREAGAQGGHWGQVVILELQLVGEQGASSWPQALTARLFGARYQLYAEERPTRGRLELVLGTWAPCRRHTDSIGKVRDIS